MPVEAMNLAWWPKATPVVRPLCSVDGKQSTVTILSRFVPFPLQPLPRFPQPLTCEMEDLCPLLADVDLDIRPAQRQIGPTLVENQGFHLWKRITTRR